MASGGLLSVQKAALETALGGYAAALQRVLADCAAENEMFSVTWEE